MILDLQTKFSGSTSAAGVTTGQAITATAISTNVLDLRQKITENKSFEPPVGKKVKFGED